MTEEDNEKQARLDDMEKDLEDAPETEESRALAAITPEQILGIEVKNLIVSPMARKHMVLGDVLSLNRAVDQVGRKVLAIVWNEESIALDLDDASRHIVFAPEIKPAAAMFFQHEERHEQLGLFQEGNRVWQGDFAPVTFGKRNFLKFIKAHMTQIPADVQEAMKRLKLSDITESSESLLDEESDNEERMERTVRTTNLPTQFSAMVPIAENFDAELHFETKVRKSQDYHERGKTVVDVRCTNARQVLRDMMEGIVAQLPPDIPRYYGRLGIHGGKE